MTHKIRLGWAAAALLTMLAPHGVQAQATNRAPPYPAAESAAPPPASSVAAQPLAAPQVPATPPPYQGPQPGSAPPGAAPYPGSAAPVGAPYPGSAPVAAPYPGALPYAGGPDAARSAYVQNLRWQREAVLARPVGLAVPITLLSVGLGAAVVGSTLANVLSDCNDYDPYDPYDDYGSCGANGGVIAGVLVAVGGAVVATVGTSMLIGRLIRRGRQRRELQRIDSQLSAYGATASLAPWMTVTGPSSAGGLTARLRF